MFMDIDWEVFLSRHDLIWPRLRYKGGNYRGENHKNVKRKNKIEWEEGAFIGNGMIGAMIYKESPTELRWELGRNDVVAHNFLKNIDWFIPRVPIGNVLLKTIGEVIEENMKLELWNAEASGEIQTEVGSIKWRSLAHAQKDVVIIELITTGEEGAASLNYIPQHGISPRIEYATIKPDKRFLPPQPFFERIRDVDVSIQTFIRVTEDIAACEGECAVAWKEIMKEKNHRILYLSITNSYGDFTARYKAVSNIEEAIKISTEEFITLHKHWWHQYYPQSFISFSDMKWEGFYWIQMYKLASAMRKNSVVLDLQGPWLTNTPWPHVAWNLNVQLTYMPIYTSNRFELGESLISTLEKNKEVLIENAKTAGVEEGMFIGRSTNTVELTSPWPSNYEIGNLTWALHNIWRQYRCTMDDKFLRDRLFPLLRYNINLYLHLLYEGDDGKWHLAKTSSPEYPGPESKTAYPIEDCTYSLALLRWGCITLLEANKKLNLKDPLQERWQGVLDNLTGYPQNGTGFMIGKDVPLATSHRHFSHLLMIYPLHLLNIDQREHREQIFKSIYHWISFEGALTGYSYTGAASMMASMGCGNEALKLLNGLVDYLEPNTMYLETGPVIETPLSAAESIHYLFLQSFGDIVRIFPAVPDQWQDISFGKLVAEGAFEISATRRTGKTEFIHIKSLAGTSLKIIPNMVGQVKVYGQRPFKFEKLSAEVYTLDIKKGESAVLYTGNTVPEIKVQPVEVQKSFLNYYGAKS